MIARLRGAEVELVRAKASETGEVKLLDPAAVDPMHRIEIAEAGQLGEAAGGGRLRRLNAVDEGHRHQAFLDLRKANPKADQLGTYESAKRSVEKLLKENRGAFERVARVIEDNLNAPFVPLDELEEAMDSGSQV